MKKVAAIILGSVVVLFFTALLLSEWWVESVFGELINGNPDRAYDITYRDFNLHTLFKGVTLESAEITPFNVHDSVTVINGSVDHIELSGIKWYELLFNKKVDIGEIALIRPEFEVSLINQQHREKKEETSGGFQALFGDILNRGIIHNFRLEGAYVVANHKSDSMLVAKIVNYNLLATEIQTDSVQAKSMIPFKVGSIYSTLDSLYYQINEYTELKTGLFQYSARDSELQLNNISLRFTKDLKEVSKMLGKQIDLIQVEAKQLVFRQLDAHSSLYHDLDIRAGAVEIDGLVLKDFRDKNQPRPPDFEKPMFNGMVDSIPIPVKVDSIIIKDSGIYYSELTANKPDAGTVGFTKVNGTIVKVTNIPEFQEQYKSFTASVEANLNQDAKLYMNLDVPYESERFDLHAVIDPFNLDILSPTLGPLAGIKVSSGTTRRFDLKMTASRTKASNTLTFDYQDLDLEVVKVDDGEYEKQGIITIIANTTIRQQNMPDQNSYQIAEYTSFRNIYRGPFNFWWETIKEGMLYIVPTAATGLLLGDPEKKAEKKQEKNQGK